MGNPSITFEDRSVQGVSSKLLCLHGLEVFDISGVSLVRSLPYLLFEPGKEFKVIRAFSAITFVILFLLISKNCYSFILVDNPGPRLELPAGGVRGPGTHLDELIKELAGITGLDLVVVDGYLKRRAAVNSPVLNAVFIPGVSEVKSGAAKWSSTARELLVSAMDSQNVYSVRGSREADLGRVVRGGSIELDFVDLKYVTFRSVPRETFNAGMIFMHELVHRHLGLMDPTVEEVKKNPDVKGPTVEFVNKIERELGLPERAHYFPKKSLDRRSNALCIYFGKGSDRVELDETIFKTKLQKHPQAAYLGLLRK
jgi:hypothetical protein